MWSFSCAGLWVHGILMVTALGVAGTVVPLAAMAACETGADGVGPVVAGVEARGVPGGGGGGATSGDCGSFGAENDWQPPTTGCCPVSEMGRMGICIVLVR